VKVAEASGVNDDELQFIERNKAANKMIKTRSDLNIWSERCATVMLLVQNLQ
jgi:hypothetical protein